MTIRIKIQRKRRSTAKSLFGFAKVLNLVATQAAGYVGAQNKAQLDALKAENLRLRNINASLQQGQQSNRVVEGDLKIELLKLKIESEKKRLGITDNPFKAEGYDEPGNVRNERQ